MCVCTVHAKCLCVCVCVCVCLLMCGGCTNLDELPNSEAYMSCVTYKQTLHNAMCAPTAGAQRHMCPYIKPRTKHQRVHFVIMLYMSLLYISLACGGTLKEQQHTGICAPTASPAQNTKGCIFSVNLGRRLTSSASSKQS